MSCGDHSARIGVPTTTVTLLERHFSPSELATAWNVDESIIRKLFIDVEGVLKIGSTASKAGKRSYVTLRIPESIALRVYKERTR